jgi:hypothetical protein
MERSNHAWTVVARMVLLFAIAGALIAVIRAATTNRAARASSETSTVLANRTRGTETRRPVLVELFTSEGCSSCPPADELLAKLDRTQPVSGAQIIVLSEHVDYWDDLGWRDPYSAHLYSERQDAYALRFGLDTVYTPQMVVDGRFETVGSNEHGALRDIERAAESDKTIVALSQAQLSASGSVAAHLEAGALPPTADSDSAQVEIAVADESDQSSVHGGENGGRTLTHVAVLRELKPVGAVNKSQGFTGDVSLPVQQPGAKILRLIAIVQAPAGRVWGAASAQLQAGGKP